MTTSSSPDPTQELLPAPEVESASVVDQEQVSRRRSTWIDAAVAAFVAGVVVMLHLVMFEPAWPNDPMQYLTLADWFDVESGQSALLDVSHRGLRLGLVGSLAVLRALFGVSEAAYYGLPLLSVGMLASATYALARFALARLPAAIAGIVVVANPMMLTKSSHPFPDVPAVALFTVGIVLVLLPERISISPMAAALCRLGAGLLFGAAYTFRESIVILAPVAIVSILVARVPWRQIGLLLAGSVAVFAAELAVLGAWAGDPFARIRVVLGRGSEDIALGQQGIKKAAQSARFQGNYSLSATAFVRHIEGGSRWMYAFLLAPLGVVLGYRMRRHAMWVVVGAWIAVVWIAYTLIGPMRTDAGGFVFRLLQLRYWYPVFPPLAIGLVGTIVGTISTIASLGGASEKKRWVSNALTGSIGVGLIAILIFAASGRSALLANGSDELPEFREWVAAQGEGIEYLTGSMISRRIAELYISDYFGQPVWTGTVRDDLDTQEATMIVLTKHPKGNSVSMVGGGEMDLSALPLSWDVAHVASNGELVVLVSSDGESNASVVGSWHTTGKTPMGDVRLVSGQQPVRMVFDGEVSVGEPRRIRVEYVSEGTRPHLTCRVDEGDSVRVVPAFKVGNGIGLASGSRVLDYYCPSPNSETRRAMLLVLANRGGTPIDVASISLIDD